MNFEMIDLDKYNSLEKLEAEGFEGTDVSLYISLCEYDVVWKEIEPGLWLFIDHLPGDAENEFTATLIKSNALDHWGEEDFQWIIARAGMTSEDWELTDFPRKILDVISYTRMDNVEHTKLGRLRIEGVDEYL